MNHFLYKLLPPRPAFPMDMTDAEGAIMQEHFAYWSAPQSCCLRPRHGYELLLWHSGA